MPQATEVLTDPATEAAYYLGFDLLLVRAPLIDGEIRPADGRVAEADPDDAAALAARYAAIRLALLKAMMGGNEAWQPAIDEALATARELASAAGMSSPPEARREPHHHARPQGTFLNAGA